MKAKVVAEKYLEGIIDVNWITNMFLAQLKDSNVQSNAQLINVIIEIDDKWKGICHRVNKQLSSDGNNYKVAHLDSNGYLKLMHEIIGEDANLLAQSDIRLKRRMEAAQILEDSMNKQPGTTTS